MVLSVCKRCRSKVRVFGKGMQAWSTCQHPSITFYLFPSPTKIKMLEAYSITMWVYYHKLCGRNIQSI